MNHSLVNWFPSGLPEELHGGKSSTPAGQAFYGPKFPLLLLLLRSIVHKVSFSCC